MEENHNLLIYFVPASFLSDELACPEFYGFLDEIQFFG
jgi:hypothetical protein